MAKNNQLGPWGEDLAAKHLQQAGYEILERNFRCRYGEIDLIAANEQFLVFAEVKLRKTADFAHAREFVDAKKQQRIRMSALIWLQEHETTLQPRFDVIEIYAPDGMLSKDPVIERLEDAFT